MKTNLNFYFISLIALLLLFNSCKMPNAPEGYMSGKDITPPVLQVCSPAQNTTVKGIVEIKILVKDLFGIKEMVFKNSEGHRIYLYPCLL